MLSHVAHNSWANNGKIRSDCWPMVGNVHFANRASSSHLPTMTSSWPPRIYRSCTNTLPPNNGPIKLFSIVPTVFQNCWASFGSLLAYQPTTSQQFSQFSNDGPTIRATWDCIKYSNLRFSPVIRCFKVI